MTPATVSPLGRRGPRKVLLNPGPVNLDARVRDALLVEDMCHREPDAYALLGGVRRLVTKLSGGTGTHASVALSGSGTSAIEAMISSVLPATGRLLVLSNGHFGERLASIAAIHGVPSATWEQGWGNAFDLDGIERRLTAEPDITHVAVVHHETSTGQLNDLTALGQIVARAGRSLLVDAVSSFGGEDLDVVRDNIDWCVASSNKCIEGPPGLAFAIGRRGAVAALDDVEERSLYLSLRRYFEAQDDRGVPLFTTAVHLLASTQCALELLAAEGVSGRRDRYRGLADTLRSGLRQLGLPLYLAHPADRSSSSTNVALPVGVTFEQLRSQLRAAGFVIYPCNDELPEYFRVANMGQVSAEDIDRFLSCLSAQLALAA